MITLIDHQTIVDESITAATRPLEDNQLAVVFCDMTSTRTESLLTQEGEIQQYGMSRKASCPTAEIGMVQSAED